MPDISAFRELPRNLTGPQGRLDSWAWSRLEHIMNKYAKIEDLRHFLTRYGLPPDRPFIPLGVAAADRALGGGLMPGALHEVYAGDWGAGSFAACLAIRAAGNKPFFWVRPDYEALEYGALHAQGVAELGGRPENLFLIKTPNAAEALAAAADILACPHAGALLLEISASPRALDLVAGRRLNFLAAQSGVPAILLREGAEVLPSAAQTRWQVTSTVSGTSSDDDDWGMPAFSAALSRNRLGPTGHWTMTWNPENGLFRESRHEQHAPHPGSMVAAVFDRPAEEKRRIAF
jgi:protein ImuA